ncbi:MAG TPA: host attachment protein [Kofleriaceae bacterium]|nr:host attachment protein [Kofleriaceae bacterium]
MLTRKLACLAREYHQLHSLHQTRGAEAEGNAAHRKMGQKMADLAARFERLVDHWIAAGDPRAEAWRRHLYDGAPEPDGPDLADPPLFRGRTDAGARIEVRRAPDETGAAYDVFSDGARIARESSPWHLEPEAIEPVTIAGQPCLDTFESSMEARDALRAFVAAASGEPPWRFARELYEDGLVDFDFALTARGRRALAHLAGQRPASSAGAPGAAVGAGLAGARAHYCVIAADAARARIFLLAADRGRAPTLMPLTEVADLARPDGRARDRDLHSESRPPRRADAFAGPGSGHGVSDHREDARRASSRDFADQVAEAAARVWRTLPSCEIVVTASPQMLGFLRPALGRRTGGPAAPKVRDLARDLSKLAPAALHDALADAGLLPPRGRREPRPLWQRDKNAG